jgi:hypothetical protein
MTLTELDRHVRHRLAVLEHAELVTGNLSMTCRYYGITRQAFYARKRRYEARRREVKARSTVPG